MAIHLLLEGEQVGPLSEAQVRQYLDEGRASVTDLASCEGMADWMPLEVVLSHLNPRAPAPESKGASTTTATSAEEALSSNDSAFVLHKSGAESDELSSPDPLRQKTQSLSATQSTKRKLNKIVVQPILPLETKLPTKRKQATGKTINLEGLRPTSSLPPVSGHQSREKRAPKGATQSGQLSFTNFTETPAAARVAPVPSAVAVEFPAILPPATQTEATVPEPVSTPADIPLIPSASTEATPVVAPPAPATAEPVKPVVTEASARVEAPKPVETAPAVEAGKAIDPPITPIEVLKPVAPLAEPAAATTVSPPIRPANAPPVHPVDVLPPPVERLSAHWKKPDRRTAGRLFAPVSTWGFYGGLALGLIVLGGILVGLYWVLAHPRPTAAVDAATSDSVAPATAPGAPPTPPSDAASAADLSDHGLALQAKGDLDGAIADYDKAIGLDPKNIEAYYRRGLARQAKGDLTGAMTDDTQVITLNPQRANAFSNRAYIKQTQGDLDGALADYFQALLINPNIAAAYNNMGLIKVKKSDLDGAIAAYNQALEINPTMAFAFYNRGVAKNTEGDVDGAIADYTQALTLNPNIAIAYCDRGGARQSKGDTDGALKDYSQALSLDPKMVDAYYNRGMIKLQQGDLNGTVADNTQAITLNPKYGQAYYHRGLAYFGLGNLDDARADLQQFCELTPRDPATDTARNYSWMVSRQQNPTGDADAQLSRAVLNDWNSPPEDLTSKIAAFLLGHMNESELIANAASPDAKREPGQYCRVWYFAGMKRLLNGETATAATYFQKSVATGQKDYYEYTFAQGQLQPPPKDSEVAAKPAPGT